MLASRGRLLDGIGTLTRLGLAAVWLISGGLKLADPGQTYLAVQAYDVLPQSLVGVVATAMPLLEITLGIFVLFGFVTRHVAVLSGLVLVAFIAAVAQSWARGLTIDCGCFGGGGQVAPGETAYPQEIARDAGFLALAVWLAVRPRTSLSVDGWLWGTRRQRLAEERVEEQMRKDASGRSGTDRAEATAAADGRG
ncbi:putative membrane protein YphA (DoxX/SURF4 family) [Saccharomonospora amisosensis]|uniref:Putative membrane protein YphA (DoxX/SURF4 family) n=1 Tax=Saccharomonospora amisosensis TaxID=1128677 RepID=A0A7X5UUA0_9PSEU|nr:MauE/DoxX family redox-associated membrane protein [Saccharomonospora amisosensis]NIJ13828.1 putative membrane protein YphA (DoxX/SURF4 family) [Saccharomonospora amisosensis]